MIRTHHRIVSSRRRTRSDTIKTSWCKVKRFKDGGINVGVSEDTWSKVVSPMSVRTLALCVDDWELHVIRAPMWLSKGKGGRQFVWIGMLIVGEEVRRAKLMTPAPYTLAKALNELFKQRLAIERKVQFTISW